MRRAVISEMETNGKGFHSMVEEKIGDKWWMLVARNFFIEDRNGNFTRCLEWTRAEIDSLLLSTKGKDWL